MNGKDLLFSKIKTIELLLNEIKEINFDIKAEEINQFAINPLKTFENFITGKGNNMAVAACSAVAKNPGKSGKYPTLFIHSTHGLGKTHLLHAIANEVSSGHPDLNVCIISAKNFMDEMIMLMKKNRINEFVKKYVEKVDILMIDDIHELKNKEGTQEQFFHLFNEMHNLGKQLVFTSDQKPSAIEGISSRVKSRLQWGLVVDIQPPDLKTCVLILRNLTQKQNFPLKEEILHLIAESTEHNPRNLESAILRIKSASELMNLEVSVDFVKEQLLLI